MKKSASACLLMALAFAVQDELFVLTAAAALSGLFAAVSLSLLRTFFRHEFRARKRVVCCQLATLVCMTVFLAWLPREYAAIDISAAQRMGQPCREKGCYESEYFEIRHYLTRRYRLSKDHRCVQVMSMHLSWPKFHRQECVPENG